MRNMYKYAFGLLKTLRGFVFTATVGVAALVFLGATLASSLLYEKLLEERSLETSKEIAQQNFNTIYQALRQGSSHQQVEELAADSISAFSSTLDQIEVYPGKAVEARYGRWQQAALVADVQQAMADGKQAALKTGSHLRYLYPVGAQQACLKCHADAKTGDVLGVIAITHKLPTVRATARIYYVALFLILGLLVLAGGRSPDHLCGQKTQSFGRSVSQQGRFVQQHQGFRPAPDQQGRFRLR